MTKEKTLIVATGNMGKAKEFEALFAKRGYTIQTLKDFPELKEVEETGETFAENARLKAETIAKELHTTVLADDSGLKVDALGGQPGVYSARYAGEEKDDARNNAKLLSELSELPEEERTAQFHCTLALAHPEKDTLVIEGEVKGTILTVPRGENGFGYDPLFYVPEKKQTMAELSSEEKNAISHRANALKKLDQQFDAWLEK